MELLDFLTGEKEVTPGYAARKLDVEKEFLTPLIADLEKNGVIEVRSRFLREPVLKMAREEKPGAASAVKEPGEKTPLIGSGVKKIKDGKLKSYEELVEDALKRDRELKQGREEEEKRLIEVKEIEPEPHRYGGSARGKTNGFPYDLKLVILWVILTDAFALLPVLNETFLRVIFAWTSILFLPGYALIALLFPKKDDLGLIERIALSFGLSAGIVPLLGLILNFTPYGIRLLPIVIILSLFIVLFSILAYLKLRKIPIRERFNENFNPSGISKTLSGANIVKFPEKRLNKVLFVILISSIAFCIFAVLKILSDVNFSDQGPGDMLPLISILSIVLCALVLIFAVFFIIFPGGLLDKVLFGILLFSIAFCVFTLIFVVSVPKPSEKFTEFYILNENGTADWYPANLSVGEEGTVNINVVSHEHETADYTVMVKFENESEVLYKEKFPLDHNETWSSDFLFKAGDEGEYKMSFLLFKNSESEVYRDLHLWVTVAKVITVPEPDEKSTEFYILNENGTADWYPVNLSVGGEGTVNINIASREHEWVEYKLLIKRDNETLHEEQVSLDHNETWSGNFTFTAGERGSKKLEFLLYKDDELYGDLHLWIDIK